MGPSGSTNVGSVYYDLDLKTAKFEAASAGVSAKLNGLGSNLTNLGEKLAKLAWGAVKTGAILASTAIVALGAKGLVSANQLQSLQISMNGLTGSMKTGAEAMAGAYQYAQKAPFQLPEVAGTTKALIAYGMSAKDAVDSLELLGNISITSGVAIQDIGNIYGRVSSQGKLMLQDIRQLTENGIGILPKLQEQLGKTSEQVQAMATNGQISFEQFKTAMASMVDPTILEQLNNTMPRQLDRLKGSIRILSNAFVGVGVDATNGFTMASNGVQQAAINLVKNVADTLRSPEITQGFAQLGTQLAPFINQISQMIKPFAGIILSIATPLISLFSGIMGGVLNLLNSALPGIQTFLGALNNAFIAIGPTLSEVGGIMGKAIGDTLIALVPVINILAQVFITLSPILAKVVALLLQMAAQVLVALAPMLPMIANAFMQIMIALMPIIPLIAQLIVQVISALIPFLPQLIKAFVDLVLALIPLLPPLLQLITILLPPLISLITFLATGVLQLLGDWVKRTVQVISTLVSAFNNVLQWSQRVRDGVIGFFSGAGEWLVNAGKNIVKGLLDGAGSILSSVGKFFLDKLPSFIREPFKKALKINSPSELFAEYGKNITEGLTLGIDKGKYDIESSISKMSNIVMKPTLQNSQANGINNNKTDITTKIYGNINIANQQDADYFFKRIDRSDTLESMGLSPIL